MKLLKKKTCETEEVPNFFCDFRFALSNEPTSIAAIFLNFSVFESVFPLCTVETISQIGNKTRATLSNNTKCPCNKSTIEFGCYRMISRDQE